MRKHSREKLFQCNQCSKQFTFEANLTTHMRIHTGEKPFICNVCDKQFKQNIQLKKHMNVHSDEKPFGCSECTKRFGCSDTLKDHMRYHVKKPFTCRQCDKLFADESSLENHKNRHMGENIGDRRKKQPRKYKALKIQRRKRNVRRRQFVTEPGLKTNLGFQIGLQPSNEEGFHSQIQQ